MGLRDLFFRRGDEGFTTAGTAVALLLAVVLAFGAVQAHWTQARSGQVQYVADAAALAADGAVAELVAYAQAADAALLSLSLMALTAYAASAVAAFVPGGQEVATRLADLGSRVFKTRDSFAESAQKGLDAAYKALPALCTLRALQVMGANALASGQEYWGVAIPLPLAADAPLLASANEAKESAEEIYSQEEQVQEEVQRQEAASKRMEEARRSAWEADCGADGPCMRERAEALAGLQGADNPRFSSPQTWSFSVALARAKAYYRTRYQQEKGAALQGDPKEVSQSVARKAYYRYALEEVSKGEVSEGGGGAEHVDLKRLARGGDQVRKTFLYTERVYPVSSGEDGSRLHSWEGCPGYAAGAPAGRGSLEGLEQGLYGECPVCGFAMRSLGRVAVPSTAIESGFEHHYLAVVEASQDYSDAVSKLQESRSKLEEAASSMQESFKEGLGSLAGARLNVQPPGRYGCVVIVVAGSAVASIGESFVGQRTELGTRMALSAATLADDPAVDQAEVLQEIGERLIPLEALTGGMAKTLFGAWGSALAAYSSGVEGVGAAVDSVLGSIPLVGTELSSWVGEGFSSAIEACNLQPAELRALKPVLCSTAAVLEADGGSVSQGLLKAKQGAEYASQVSLGDLSQVLELLESVDVGNPDASGAESLVLATLSLVAGGLGVGEKSIEIELDEDAVRRFAQAVAQVKGVL